MKKLAIIKKTCPGWLLDAITGSISNGIILIQLKVVTVGLYHSKESTSDSSEMLLRNQPFGLNHTIYSVSY